MPSSSRNGKVEIAEWFYRQTDIHRVLDIGCGKGTYPLLLGNKYYWVGIEIYEPYVAKYKLDKLYRDIWIGDCTLMSWPAADCVILGDVVEHLEKAVALATLERADKNYRHVIISIPLNSYQGAVLGNAHEEHKSIWGYEELDGILPTTYTRKRCGDVAIFLK